MQATQAATSRQSTRITRAIEAGWLTAAVLIPIAVAHDSWMVGFIQMPKVFLLRSIAVYLLVLLAVEWAVRPSLPRQEGGVSSVRVLSRLWLWAKAHPARWILFGAAAVLVANVISLLFSPVRSIGLTGVDPGWDTYGLFSVASYIVLFVAVVTHLKTADQLRRLLWALTGASMLAGLYAIWQHFGLDIFRSGSGPLFRATGSFGNPIFLGSFLVLTIPLTLAVFLPYRARMSTITHIWLGAGLIALQTSALLFSLSRGPWVAFAFSMTVLLVLAVWVWTRHEGRFAPFERDPSTGEARLGPAVRILAMLLVAGVISMLLNLVPVIGSENSAASAVGSRVASIAPDVGGGLNNRRTIWTTAAQAYVSVPWVDTQAYPEIPDLGFRFLRPIVGYGPDMFQYAYPLVGESTYTFELASHGHNFLVHTALELGLLGILAYGLLAGAIGLYLFRMLRRAQRGEYPFWVAAVLVGLGGALAGRMLEQIPGKAQVSDLSLSWMLAATVAAMVSMRFEEAPASDEPSPDRRARQRRPRRTASAARAPQDPLRIAAVSVFAILALAFWVVAVVSPVRAAFIVADAAGLEGQGSVDAAVGRYIDARDVHFASAITHLRLAQALFNAAQGTGVQEDREDLLGQAQAEIDVLMERNPLDHRAWSRVAEIQRELFFIDPGGPEQGDYNSQVLTALLPGFWQSQAGLAFTYTRLGEHQLALDAVARAKDLSSTFSTVGDLNILHFIEALALKGLGLDDEAIAAATRSMELGLNLNACRLLLDYGATAVVDSFNVICE